MTAQPVRSTGAEMDRHYLNVGLVAVATTRLEETAALIVYAAKGGWDNSDEHLKEMASSWRLREELDKAVAALPAEVETTHVDLDTGSRRVERGEVRCRLEAFAEALGKVVQERNRIVHSVVGQHLWDPEVLAVHAYGLKEGKDDAARPLPSDDEIFQLVETIDELIREGRRLMGRVAALMQEGPQA